MEGAALDTSARRNACLVFVLGTESLEGCYGGEELDTRCWRHELALVPCYDSRICTEVIDGEGYVGRIKAYRSLHEGSETLLHSGVWRGLGIAAGGVDVVC